MTNIQEREFTNEGFLYLIQAEKKVINYKKLRKMNLFNRKKIISEASSYQNGSFKNKQIEIDFAKAYFYEGDFYMQDCYCNYRNGTIKAKDAVYKKTYIEFKGLLLLENGKKYHKFIYRVDLE